MSTGQRVRVFLLGAGLGLALVLALIWPHRETATEPPPPVPAGQFPREYTDAHARRVQFEDVPRRLVSLAPSTTEILFAIGAGRQVVGRTQWCQYPPEAEEIPALGNLDSPDLERLAQLWPDAVVGSTLTPRAVYEQIDKLGFPAVAFAHTDFEGVLNDIGQVSILIGRQAQGAALVSEMRRRAEAVDAAVARANGGNQPRVVLLYGLEPLVSAGAGTWPGDLLARCGAENLAARAGSPWPMLSMEAVAEADPEVILLTVEEGDPGAAEYLERLRGDPLWRELTAVRTGHVQMIDNDLLAIPGPRMIDAFEALAAAIWPELTLSQE